MKTGMRFRIQAIVVLCTVVLSYADEDYENKLTKLWSMTGARNSDGSAVLNVTSASIVIQPSSYSNDYNPSRISRDSRPQKPHRRYAFKPRAIPLRRDAPSQVERSVYYSQDNHDKYKSDVLFPGNYFQIAKEKSNENITGHNPVNGGQFHPKAIPLIRTQEFQKRSLDVDSDPIIEKPEDFLEQVASRRSISYLFGEEGDDAEEEEEEEVLDELETEQDDHKVTKGFKHKKPLKPKLKKTKLKKYVLPLLLAYKMKYFALVPVMIGGLILLIGATGLAGFFFALFAAVMGLQKGGY